MRGWKPFSKADLEDGATYEIRRVMDRGEKITWPHLVYDQERGILGHPGRCLAVSTVESWPKTKVKLVRDAA